MQKQSKFIFLSKYYSVAYKVSMNISNVFKKTFSSLFNHRLINDNNQRFHLAAEDDQLADWEWDLGTNLIQFNKRFVQRAGGVVNENTVSLKSLLEVIHTQDKEKVEQAVSDYVKSPSCPLELKFRIYDADHQCLTIQCRGMFAKNNSLRVLGIFNILSANERVERKLNRYLQLEQLMADLSQKFLTVHKDNVEKALVEGLKLLTDNIEGVRSCLIHCGPEQADHIPNVYEWGEPVYNSMNRFMISLNGKELESVCSLFSSDNTIFLPDSLLDTTLQKQILIGMDSSLAIALPLKGEGLGAGCLLLGFDEYSEPWRKEDVSLLRSIADLFFIILDREAVQTKLQERQELLIENQTLAKIGSWSLKNDSDILTCSPEIYKIFEVGVGQDINFELFLQFVHPDDRQNAGEIIGQSIEERVPYNFVYRIISTTGKLKYVQGRGQAIVDEDGKLLRRVGTVIDVTEHKLAEEKNRLSAIMFESTQEGALITDKNTYIIAVNKAFTDITGYSEEEALGNRPNILKSGKQNDKFYAWMKDSLDRNGSWEGEICNKRKNGELYPEWLSIKNVYDDNDQIINRIAVFSDISHLKKTEEQIEQLSHHDQLTGLPNRLLFQSRLTHALDIAKRNKYPLAVMYIDLDNFKNINDSFGHEIGDDVLLMVSERLKNRIRESDTLARIGGDEYILLLEQVEGVEQVAYVAQSILELMAEPFEFSDGKNIFLGVSIGVSFYPNDGLSASELISHADAAVSQAKDNGRNSVHFYTLELTKAAQERMLVESELRRALAKNNELQLYYQPQVNMESGDIVGAEALLRWLHPNDGIVSPMTFLPVAEKSGLMAAIDYWVLETACLQHANWQRAGFPFFILAINITKYSFMDVSFLSKINAIISKTGVDPKTIELEITEGALIEPSPQVIQTIAELKYMGFTLAIDDFGTGYSSLAYLQRFNVDKLKIDRSFVKDVLTDSQGAAITSAIISMAKSLNLQILAEGVENKEQLALLKAKGCEIYQGFYFSKPIPVKEFEVLILGHKT
jgi:diguanylate cyclase (GGDEF)-like protein/PAS domain S-box-containing protein